jgi:hypothetical protein
MKSVDLTIPVAKKGTQWVNENHKNPHAKILQEKKQAIIHDCDAGDGIHVEYTEAGTVVFDQGTAVLPNDSRANEIMAELKTKKGYHRDRYAYVRNRESRMRDSIHNYTFGYSAIPQDKWDMIFGKDKKDG